MLARGSEAKWPDMLDYGPYCLSQLETELKSLFLLNARKGFSGQVALSSTLQTTLPLTARDRTGEIVLSAGLWINTSHN